MLEGVAAFRGPGENTSRRAFSLVQGGPRVGGIAKMMIMMSK